jgi:hypothetical protein
MMAMTRSVAATLAATLAAARAATLVAASVVAAAAVSPAWADTDTFSLHGNRLVMTLGSNNDVAIRVDSSLHGEIRISGDNAGCLESHGGGDAVVIDDTSCGNDLDNLILFVPPQLPLILTTHGSGNVTAGNLESQVVATVTGNGDVHFGRVAGLVLNVSGSADSIVESVNGPAEIVMSGNGDVKIPQLNGPLHVRQSGAGDLVIGQIATPAIDLDMDGSGDVAIGRGAIGVLHARVSASGDLTVAATAQTADLSATGGGDIRVAEVTGAVQRHSSGGSTISTNSSGLERLGVGKLASIAAASDDDDGGTRVVVRHGRGGSGAGHFFAGLVVLVILFLIYRTVQRRGGMAAVTNSFRGGPGLAQPTHPGVIAVRDTMTRLEARLARVEGYVTEREFDLHRKFRDLEARK